MTSSDIADSVFFPPFDTCPGCRATGLTVTAAGDQARFFCSACQAYWHVDLGWVHQVEP